MGGCLTALAWLLIVAVCLVPLGALCLYSLPRPRIWFVLAAYALLVPFGSAINLPITLPSPFDTVSSILGVLALLATVVHLAFTRRRASRLTDSVPIWIMFLGWVTLTYLWSVDGPRTLNEVALLVGLIGLFSLVALVRVGREDLPMLRGAIILGGCVVGVLSLYALGAGKLVGTAGGIPRFAVSGGGEGGDPNITAGSLLLPLVLAVDIILQSPRATRKLMGVAAAGLITVAIVLTGSRGGILAALVGLLVLVMHRRRPTLVLSFLLATGLAAVAVFALAPSTLRSRIVTSTSTGRSGIWEVAIGACKTYCWVGSGIGTFPDVYTKVLLTRLDLGGHNAITQAYQAHNLWLAFLVEDGGAGFLLGTLALALLIRSLWRLPRAVRGPPLAAVLALLASNMFLNNLAFKYFWLVLIYAVIVINSAESPEATPRELPDPEGRLAGIVDL